MLGKSIYRDFIANLRKGWKKDLPSLRPLTEARKNLPKASTFYAGVMRDSGQHVYFQHSDKSWQVGQFTINVVVASDELNPKMYPANRSGSHFGEGYHRIGDFVGTKDKWWHLNQDDDPILTEAWRPSSYQNTDIVLSEAVDDVTRDVLSALRLLQVPVEAS